MVESNRTHVKKCPKSYAIGCIPHAGLKLIGLGDGRQYKIQYTWFEVGYSAGAEVGRFLPPLTRAGVDR